MNRNQKIVVAIGVLLIVLSGLFPPYEGKFTGEGVIKCRIGHYLFFTPPTPDTVSKYMYGIPADGWSSLQYDARIMLSEVLFQLLIVILMTTGLAIILATRRRLKPPFEKIEE